MLYWSGLVVLVLVAFAGLVVEMIADVVVGLVIAVVVVLALLSVALNYLDYTSDVVGMIFDSAHVSEGTIHDSDCLYSIVDCDHAVAVAAQRLLQQVGSQDSMMAKKKQQHRACSPRHQQFLTTAY